MVPLGTLATCVAVGLAAQSVRVGNKKGAQKWFRYRVVFQGFTIAALVVGGLFFGKESIEKQKSREELLHEKAKMREKLWIEELERRDFETQQRKKRAEWARQKAKEAQEEEAKQQTDSPLLRELEKVKKVDEEQKKDN